VRSLVDQHSHELVLHLAEPATNAHFDRRVGDSTAVLAAQDDARPNVLLILTDDQGYGDFSVHGNPHLETPHIDELARTGIRFERFYVNSFCAPTRAALLTGVTRCGAACGASPTTRRQCGRTRSRSPKLCETRLPHGLHRQMAQRRAVPLHAARAGIRRVLRVLQRPHQRLLRRRTAPRLHAGVPTRGYITDVLTDEAIRFLHANRERPCVRPVFLADLISFGVESCPVLVPHSAVVQGGQGHHGFGVGAVPASSAAFDA
jgi:hypothetical protein